MTQYCTAEAIIAYNDAIIRRVQAATERVEASAQSLRDSRRSAVAWALEGVAGPCTARWDGAQWSFESPLPPAVWAARTAPATAWQAVLASLSGVARAWWPGQRVDIDTTEWSGRPDPSSDGHERQAITGPILAAGQPHWRCRH